MYKIVASLILSFILLPVFNNSMAEETPPPPPLDPKYMGIHGMKLLNKGSSVYASYMLSLKKPKNVQILYKLDISQLFLLQFIKDADVPTLTKSRWVRWSKALGSSSNLQRLVGNASYLVKLGNIQEDGSWDVTGNVKWNIKWKPVPPN